jgi:hypothetical protein
VLEARSPFSPLVLRSRRASVSNNQVIFLNFITEHTSSVLPSQ